MIFFFSDMAQLYDIRRPGFLSRTPIKRVKSDFE